MARLGPAWRGKGFCLSGREPFGVFRPVPSGGPRRGTAEDARERPLAAFGDGGRQIVHAEGFKATLDHPRAIFRRASGLTARLSWAEEGGGAGSSTVPPLRFFYATRRPCRSLTSCRGLPAPGGWTAGRQELPALTGRQERQYERGRKCNLPAPRGTPSVVNTHRFCTPAGALSSRGVCVYRSIMRRARAARTVPAALASTSRRKRFSFIGSHLLPEGAPCPVLAQSCAGRQRQRRSTT